MKITRLRIRNIYGISEFELDGSSVMLEGDNGTGKTSVIHAIKYALTNQPDREKVIRGDSKEGEVLIETDSGLSIVRKKREEQADYKSVRQNGREVQGPEALLRSLFTPLQIDPVAFTRLSKAEQNKTILELIDFKWDINWIRQEFGEIPSWVDYSQHILVVLDQIQSEDGNYFKDRQDINREIRHDRAFVEKIAAKLPPNYDAKKWTEYSLGDKYRELEAKRNTNKRIEDARNVRKTFEGRLRELDAWKETQTSTIDRVAAADREALSATIEALEAKLKTARNELAHVDDRLTERLQTLGAQYAERKAKLDAEYSLAGNEADLEPEDVSALFAEVQNAENMKRFLNEHAEMLSMQTTISNLEEQSQTLTYKIEHARALPGMILQSANLPIEGLTVENGIPMINGLPISNLSEGEQLDLCVDVTLAKPNGIQIILLDGIETLSDRNKERVFQKCREHGVQFIATNTTNADTMEVHYL
jgi:DNA repair exonuclease SbcCD ATPase subunit